MQRLDPLRILDVAFLPRHPPQRARADQQALETLSLQFLEQQNPIHPSAFHRHALDVVFLQPLTNRLQVHRVVPEPFHDLRALVPCHTHHDLRCADVHPRRVRVHPAHPGKRMRLFQPLRALTFPAHFLLTPFRYDFGREELPHLRQARSLAGISFLNGVALYLPTADPTLSQERPQYARRQFLNQFDRKPRCTTGVASSAHRQCYVRLAHLPFRSILPPSESRTPVSLVQNDGPPIFSGCT